ncbi:small tumor antigen [Myotis daubentonii polyomavirus 1]|uniref:Small tumor antigen n=1 Tax=Myotis daubentonii polyomavirus 1 TaxID=2990517 RepID=A0AAE9P9G8_9POLY|nr:small tumor antigen [Myotis daubentonii polyomavirus 1]
MDSALTHREKKELCRLLELPRHCYGNYPMMRDRYRSACLRLHPDKGGDLEAMTLLNSLWQKFTAAVYEMRRQFPTLDEVSAPTFFEQDFPTLGDRMRGGLKLFFWRGPNCFKMNTSQSMCVCICCRLHRQHYSFKLLSEKNCLVWGECFCLSCFLLWFGFPLTWECIEEWQKIIEHTDFRLLHLLLY